MNKTKILLLVTVLLLFTATSVSALTYGINGTIYRADTGVGLSGATVTNGSNTTTTNATGFYTLPNMQNDTVGWTLTITAPNDGYNNLVITNVVINGNHNTTARGNLTVVTPVISGITESSVKRTSATVAWTSSISTVGNRILYTKDSGYTNNLKYTSWSNSTASPSFSLTMLDIFNTYYYRLQVYNTNNESYSATSDGDFKTLAGYPSDEEDQNYAIAVSAQTSNPSAPASIVSQAQNKVTESNTTKAIAFIIIVLILYLVLGGGKKK